MAPVVESPANDIRVKVRALVDERVPGLQTERQLDSFLDELMRKARANNQVTALEIEPGLIALRSFRGKLDPEAVQRKTTDFLERMKQLSELNATAAPAPDAALASLLAQMDQATTPDALGHLQSEYIHLATGLEPDLRRQALTNLEKRRLITSTAEAR